MLLWCTESPSVITVAFGSNFCIVLIVPEKQLPFAELNGIIVFPEKSYSSKKEYITCCKSYHHVGYSSVK
jgi:hypothetical protein